MLTRWMGHWIETPRPTVVPGAAEIRVEATAPLFPTGAVHGREFGNPVRKVASFAVTDGPKATIRKVKSKRAEGAYTGDYHLTLILGTVGERRVLALAPRAPSCAGWMLAPEALVRDAPDGPAEEVLRTGAMAVSSRVDAADTRQSYLYSTMEPPQSLVAAIAAAAQGDVEPDTADDSFEFLRPPADAAGEVDQILALPVRGPAPYAPPLVILGAGDYVRIEALPALEGAKLRRGLIVDREPQIAALAAENLDFLGASTDAMGAIDALRDRGLVVVATAHDSHAALAAHALEKGHRVFAEKPAVVTPADLDTLLAAAEANPGELEVGFNRRWNPVVERARRELHSGGASGPLTIAATIREVDITPDHWYLWPNQGTRVAGNLCHWIDLALYLIGPGPRPTEISVSPRVSSEPTGIDAERTFTVAFDDGSSVTLLPTARGDSVRGVQEQIEVRRGSLTLRIDDLWRLNGLRAGRPIRFRTLWRDKGHAPMYRAALGRFERNEPSAYPLEDLRRVSEIQLAGTELLQADLPGGKVSELVASARARA